MNYEKMKALMEASRDESAAQRKTQVKEFPKPESTPDWKYLDSVRKEPDCSLMEVLVMRTPTRFQWFQILRKQHGFTLFQAVRGALWLASSTI